MHLSIEDSQEEEGGLHRGETFKGNTAFIYLPMLVGQITALHGYPGGFQAQTPHGENAAAPFPISLTCA